MTATARTWRVRGAVALAVALLVAATTLTLASASQLNLNASSGSSANVLNKCASQTLTATPTGTVTSGNYTAVQVSGIAVGCQGASTLVELRNSSGALLASGTATPTGASTTFTTGSYTGTAVTAAIVKVGGWLFRPTWQPAAPLPAITCKPVNNGGNTTGGSCTVTVTGGSGWTSYPGEWGVGTPYYHYTLSFDVASNQDNWQITVNFGDTTAFPLYNAPPVFVGNGYNIVKAPGYSCSSLPTFVGRKQLGNVSWGNNGYIYFTSAPGSTNGTVQLCP